MTSTPTCESCGKAFEIPKSTREKFPGWTPSQCSACYKPKARGAKGRRKSKGSSGTKELDLTKAQVLERFQNGPSSGVFTDGACTGNPGPGGWGAVYVRDGEIVEERCGEDPATTNNRMELQAMIAGLRMAPVDERVDIYSDSQLVVNTVTKWAAGWEAHGWQKNKGKGGAEKTEVKNLDLVKEVYAASKSRPLVRVQWVRAHEGTRWNEYADALATAFRRAIP
jgi:ribonuclease HI